MTPFFLRMSRVFAKRTLNALTVLFAVASLCFVVLQLTPGDPVLAIMGGGATNATPETLIAARHEYGLDRPVLVQYGLYLSRLARGEFGQSFSQHMPVTEVLRVQAPPTLELMATAFAVAWLFALLSVMPTVRRRYSGPLASALETVCAGLPPFWLGLLLLWAFAFELGLFPPAGTRGVMSIVLPALAMGIPLGGFLAQITRESFDLALDEPCILTARARGLDDRTVRLRHVLRHALLPGVDLSAWGIGALVGNAVAIEMIFSRKGLGRELFLAVSNHDMPLVAGIILFIAVIYIIAGLLADLLRRLIDPRLKASYS
ncbi:ABC transporter permease [Acetobacter fallax]|uniref:ABC transporter permease subunit n=1 Tax=Acetobacter fallax TaxID=1737473 RepID=A0ABX0KFH7_9PROT|nr:ABC transporter permease [Acetobacter fallax]NHO33881.1 ABC transporter permease subunit [Acetobacter fallax]NHO37437.1 ABC transporter permease subunit [Acetobacter fallax]